MVRMLKVVVFQIEGPTQANIYGLKHTPGTLADPAVRERQTMTVFSCEVFGTSRLANQWKTI